VVHLDSWIGAHGGADPLAGAIGDPAVWHEIFPDQAPGDR